MIPSTFTVAHYHFTLTARDPMSFPPYKGSALRGGFGHAFKSMVCAYQGNCDKRCRLGNACPYGYIFETAPPDDTEVLSTFGQIPRPFVIEPPADHQTDYAPGETLAFQVTLVGKATDFLTYFILAFQELGRRGLGRTRGRFRLARVEAVHPLTGDRALVFDEAVPARIQVHSLPVSWGAIAARAAALPPDRITLDFLTPTRLKHNGRWIEQGPPFQALVKTLLGRISSLSYFHCGQRLETDFRGLIDRAAGVRITQRETRWHDWSRFSGRQKQRVEMGGLVGRVTYEGDLGDYLPLLALGELVQVGKGTVFGNGRYRIGGKKGVDIGVELP